MALLIHACRKSRIKFWTEVIYVRGCMMVGFSQGGRA